MLKRVLLYRFRAVSVAWALGLIAGVGRVAAQNPEPCRIVAVPVPELPEDSLKSWEKWEQFGVEIPLNLSLHLRAGECLLFSAPGAVTLSLNFGEGLVPLQGLVSVVSEKGTVWQELRATLWRRGMIWPATLPCYGDSLTLIYSGPDSAYLSITGIVYGYRDWRAKARGFGDSGPCNNNVNCGFDEWNNEKRSVVMMLTAGNTRKCTGALINTTAQDGRPYVLTARHCNVATSNIFLFNYESPGCSAIDGPLDQWIQGCTILASWAPSDFALVELSEVPPQQYFPFYAGWNRTTVLPASGVTSIHHPRGDVKKISFSGQNPQASPYITASDTTRDHWHVAAWDSGTTEPVSSGSPLFDAQHRIIGQLHGGQASCNFNFNDYYGMLYYSWSGGGTPTTALQSWLDPLGLNPDGLPGLDPYQPLWNVDAGFTSKQLDVKTCESTLSVLVKVRNQGLDSITGLRLKRLTDQGIQLLKDTLVNLSYSGVRAFSLEFEAPHPGTTREEILVLETFPEPDENPLNDTLHLIIFREKGESFSVRIFTDNYGGETRVFLLDESLDTLWKADPLPSNTLSTWTFCEPYGCYIVRVTDSGGDGVCCNHGHGFLEVVSWQDHSMGRVEEFGSQADLSFCIPYADPSLRPLVLYPVPAQNILYVLYKQGNSPGATAHWQIISPQGSVVKEGVWHNYLNTFDVSALAAGLYLFTIREKDKVATRKFVKY